MGDGSLTQDEIDALLQGADDFSAQASGGDSGGGAGNDSGSMSPSEKDALSEHLQQALLRSAGSVASYVDKDVRFANTYTDTERGQKLNDDYGAGYVSFQASFSGDVSGDTHLVISMSDAVKIAASLLSQESANESEIDGAQEQALKEMFSPMITAYMVNIASRSNVNFSTGPVKMIPSGQIQMPGEEQARISFNMSIPGLVDARLSQVMPVRAAQVIARGLLSGGSGGGGGGPAAPAQQGGGQVSQVAVEEVDFPDMQQANTAPLTQANLNLLLDIKMDLTVELGRTRKYVKEILSLGEGSIIELDKLAGEPVDLLVNNKLIARGEVVVIDENFGVRVTDIVKPEERLKTMNEGSS